MEINNGILCSDVNLNSNKYSCMSYCASYHTACAGKDMSNPTEALDIIIFRELICKDSSSFDVSGKCSAKQKHSTKVTG